MGRRRDPNVARLQKKAIRLAEKGLSAPKIAIQVGRSVDTVQRWLRSVRGPRKSAANEIVILLKDGKSIEEVVALTDCTAGYVRRIRRDRVEGWTKQEHRSTDELVAEYLSDPQKYNDALYVTKESFGWGLLYRCHKGVRDNPKGAGKDVALAQDLFEGLLEIRRKPSTRRFTLCQYCQSLANSAARCRSLEDPEMALRILRRGLDIREGCVFCEADLSRRAGMALRDLGHFEKAHEMNRTAQAIYINTSGPGHDVNRNGLGNCALAQSQIFFYQGCQSEEAVYFERAAAVSEMALQDLVMVHEKEIHEPLRLTLAYSLFRSGRAIAETRKVVEELREGLTSKPSVSRIKILWFIAKIAEFDDDITSAESDLQDALVDAHALRLPAGVAAITADLEGLSPNPTSLQKQISRLRLIDHRGRLTSRLPDWLKPITRDLNACLRLLPQDVRGALAELRRPGDSFLPRIAKPTSSQPALSIRSPNPA